MPYETSPKPSMKKANVFVSKSFNRDLNPQGKQLFI